MITEDYLNFETAKILKEKGFDWMESPFYSEQDRDEWRQNNSYTVHNEENNAELPFDSETLTMAAPHVSLQIAMKWLREMHKWHIEISRGEYGYFVHVVSAKNLSTENYTVLLEGGYNLSYEEACEVAIKYCLENLI